MTYNSVGLVLKNPNDPIWYLMRPRPFCWIRIRELDFTNTDDVEVLVSCAYEETIVRTAGGGVI